MEIEARCEPEVRLLYANHPFIFLLRIAGYELTKILFKGKATDPFFVGELAPREKPRDRDPFEDEYC